MDTAKIQSIMDNSKLNTIAACYNTLEYVKSSHDGDNITDELYIAAKQLCRRFGENSLAALIAEAVRHLLLKYIQYDVFQWMMAVRDKQKRSSLHNLNFYRSRLSLNADQLHYIARLIMHNEI